MSGAHVDREQRPAIVLVRPQLAENIGSAARVMANFGLSDLRLVAPRDGWPNPQAVPLAAGALEGVVSVSVYDTTHAAVGDLGFVAATTARGRDLTTPVRSPMEVVAARASDEGSAWGVVFGPEASGLSNADLALADVLVTYPVNPQFGSLNLAQAVGVFAYAWRTGALGDGPQPRTASSPEPSVQPLASKADVVGLQDHFIDALARAGFFFPPEKAEAMQLSLRALLARSGFSHQEVQTLRGAIKALEQGPRRRALAMLRGAEGDDAGPDDEA